MTEGEARARADIIARFDAMAKVAQEGRRILDARPDGAVDDGFGASGYADTAGLPDGALRASLGCGDPVGVADPRPGETVLDLGCGGGLDVLLAARRVGPAGKVYGLDASAEMIELAKANAAEAGAGNVGFLHAAIEDVPLPDASVDVIVSNYVINLSVDKPRVLEEAYRVLRPGGRIAVADVIAEDGLDPDRRAAAERRVGCRYGTLTEGEYRALLARAGFGRYTVTRARPVIDGLHAALIRAGKPDAPPGIVIRPMRTADADQVLAIYQAGLDGGNASFETTAPSWEAFDAGKLPLHRYVAVEATTGQVVGWVAVSPVSGRCVYAGVVEDSVYVHPDHAGRGIGLALLNALIQSTEAAGVWTIEAGVFPENTASLRLHEKAGFRIVGTRHRLGRHHGRWRDVVLIERRSPVVGV